VIVPCFNDVDVLRQTHQRLLKTIESDKTIVGEIVYVDDGSSDTTADILNSLVAADDCVVAVFLTRNFGHQAAISAGLQIASGDVVAIIDSDLQDPPELILEMLAQWRAGYDVVYGIRAQREGGLAKRAAYSLFYRLMRAMVNFDIPADSGDFSLMDRRAVDALNALPERNRYVRGLRAWIGLRQIGIPYRRPLRAAGASKYTFIKLIRLSADGILSMSSRPLSVIFVLGLLSTIFSATCFMCYFLWWISGAHVFGHSPADVPGFTSIALLLFFISGIQMISIGVIGGYVGRIYDEIKNRPMYLIDGVARSRNDVPALKSRLPQAGASSSPPK
jgi:dolichol-phosphate mannosyltransferase